MEIQPFLRSVIRQNMDIDIACSVLTLAEAITDKNLQQFCQHFIAKNYKKVKDTEMFRDLPQLQQVYSSFCVNCELDHN